MKFCERGAHFSMDGWETLVAGSAKYRRTEVGGGDKQTILVAHSYNSSEHGDRLSRSDDPRLGSWYHEHVRNECSALAGTVTVARRLMACSPSSPLIRTHGRRSPKCLV